MGRMLVWPEAHNNRPHSLANICCINPVNPEIRHILIQTMKEDKKLSESGLTGFKNGQDFPSGATT